MSRDLTSEEWAAEVLRGPERELEKLTRHTEYIRRAAYLEGMTAHLRNTYWGCPFCDEGTANLPEHLILCEQVPEHLRESLPGEKVPE